MGDCASNVVRSGGGKLRKYNKILFDSFTHVPSKVSITDFKTTVEGTYMYEQILFF